MILIYKKRKKQEGSFINLTSCVVKTTERILNARLIRYLEPEDILSKEQAGFRQFRCTEDQATYPTQEINDAFKDQKANFATWTDLLTYLGLLPNK